jgi:hypothetical protein
MHGGAGAKNRYACRRVQSDVGSQRGGRGHSEGSAVTLLLCANLYSITTNQEAIRVLFRVINRYVGNLPPMPGVFPDYPGDDADALGHAATAAHGRPAGHEHPQHVLAALARLAQSRKTGAVI